MSRRSRQNKHRVAHAAAAATKNRRAHPSAPPDGNGTTLEAAPAPVEPPPTPAFTTAAPAAPSQAPAIDRTLELKRAPNRPTLWLDALLALLLFLAALPLRWDAARGDLWLDEASYAMAGARGFEANRWDISDTASEPEKLIRLRHYHPPLTAQLMGLASSGWGKLDRTLRAPFMVAGGLTVVLTYLCGLSLFRRSEGLPAQSRKPHPPTFWEQLSRFTLGMVPRWAALFCAVVVLFTPPQVRASSHALPWALITLWLMALLWTLLRYAETRRTGWLIAAFGTLGGMYVTSEYLLPTLLAAGVAAPFLFWRDFKAKDRVRWRRIAEAFAFGISLFVLVALVLWPAGLTGGTLTMLRHYMEMADDHWPVVIQGQAYDRAPKWAYLYWYFHEYLPYLIFYALGLGTALVLIVQRKLGTKGAVLLAFTAVILFVAHASHIIGPEYLAHVLPMLTLIGGLFLTHVLSSHRPLAVLPGIALLTIACGFIARHVPSVPLSGMEPKAQQSRWPKAARFIKAHWKTGDKIIASQYAIAARWYLVHREGIPPYEGQVEGLPEQEAKEIIVRNVREGVYRYVVVGNSFMDWTPVNNHIRWTLRDWPLVWRSEENDAARSRLLIYEYKRPEPKKKAPPPQPQQQQQQQPPALPLFYLWDWRWPGLITPRRIDDALQGFAPRKAPEVIEKKRDLPRAKPAGPAGRGVRGDINVWDFPEGTFWWQRLPREDIQTRPGKDTRPKRGD